MTQIAQRNGAGSLSRQGVRNRCHPCPLWIQPSLVESL